MATETSDGSAESAEEFDPYLRGITVTTAATLLGIVAAVCSTLFATTNGDPASQQGLVFLLGAIVVQLPFYKVLGIDVEDFGAKDMLYIFFMTFALWFVTWSLFLTTGALQ